MNSNYDKNDILDEIDETEFRGGPRSIYEGVQALTSSQFRESRGDRDGIENVAVVITTGAANEDVTRTQAEAQKARDEEIYIFSVGLSDDVDEEEVKLISSLPQNKNAQYFLDSDFRGLTTLADTITDKICRARDSIPVTTTTTVAPSSGKSDKHNHVDLSSSSLPRSLYSALVHHHDNT